MTVHAKVMSILTVVFLVILSVLALDLVQQGRYDYAQNILVKIIMWIGYSFFEIKNGIQLNNTLRASVMLVLISDSFLGLYWDFYTTSSVFDKVQHAFGSYAFSLFVFTIISKLSRPVLGRGFTFIVILSLGLGIGALYEIGEFLGDTILKPRIPSQPNLLDTDLDLIADMLGALFAAVHVTIVNYIGSKL